MRLSRLCTAVLTGAVILTPSIAQAQGFSRIARPRPTGPRLMVATPFASASADSAAAVEIGAGVRDRMVKVAGSDYQIIPDSVMNSALLQYGYSKDAILSPLLALTLAKNIQARVIVSSTAVKTEGGRFRATARIAGVNDEAGYTVSQVQAAGTGLRPFGEQVANALQPSVDVLDEARACVDQRSSKPDKALEAANKAIAKLPTHGLANLCLAQLAQDKKAPATEVIGYLEKAVTGDSLSLKAWTELASLYAQKGDTAKTVAAYSQMLRVAPTNQKLREEIFRALLSLNAPDRARQVADEGLAIDPFNWDLYDLKSNACLFQGDFKCAVQALQQAYTVDSVRADTLFFTKVSVAAQQGNDTTSLVRWAKAGTKKFPDNITLLGYLNAAYVMSGQTDSAMVVTRKLMQVDPTNAIAPALAITTGLAKDKRLAEAGPFAQFVEQKGDQTQKDQLAVVYVNQGLALLQEPRDLKGSAEFARKGVALATPGGKLSLSGNYVLGLSTFFGAAGMDADTEKQKSCDMAKQEQALLDESEKALTIGKDAQPEQSTKYLSLIGQFRPRVSSMLKAYCK